ncbi:hypothetical protein FJT64_022155 [Amphibalanus amphitrite]|uniref:Uncharacterized protein n=1 Tax=Amphibalanus amphitrite TaxID=1232801 RepID=A0A6A4WVD5_AMPAM|nr:hypothetical protein FJT64_022155 [Amphibalanus amphitrite]
MKPLQLVSALVVLICLVSLVSAGLRLRRSREEDGQELAYAHQLESQVPYFIRRQERSAEGYVIDNSGDDDSDVQAEDSGDAGAEESGGDAGSEGSEGSDGGNNGEEEDSGDDSGEDSGSDGDDIEEVAVPEPEVVVPVVEEAQFYEPVAPRPKPFFPAGYNQFVPPFAGAPNTLVITPPAAGVQQQQQHQQTAYRRRRGAY